MPKYLWKASYTQAGVKGVVDEGGTGRKAAVEELVTGAGGTVEAFYFAFGGSDVYVIADLPDERTALAISMAVNGVGAVTLETVPLIDAADVDAAAKQSVSYRPPGG